MREGEGVAVAPPKTGSHISRIDILQVRPAAHISLMQMREKAAQPAPRIRMTRLMCCNALFFTSSIHLPDPPGVIGGLGMRVNTSLTSIGNKSRVLGTFRLQEIHTR